MDGTYDLGFNSDDGAKMRIVGQDWNSILPGSNGDAVIDGEWLTTDALTGSSYTAGEIDLAAGFYKLEVVMFERGGGAGLEVFGRNGARCTFWRVRVRAADVDFGTYRAATSMACSWYPNRAPWRCYLALPRWGSSFGAASRLGTICQLRQPHTPLGLAKRGFFMRRGRKRGQAVR